MTHKTQEAQVYAEQVRNAMRKRASSSEDATTREHWAFAQVFGEEHPGRVRGYGTGVCPSEIFGVHAEIARTLGPDHQVADLQSEVRQLRASMQQQIQQEVQKQVQQQMEQYMVGLHKRFKPLAPLNPGPTVYEPSE